MIRNSEISGVMKGQSNGGVRAITSPDRVAPEKRPPSNHDNHHPHHKSAATSDTKKGGSSSGSGEALAPPSQGQPAWPPKFVIALTNKEKEEDFMAIKGSKLPQRPKKRAKLIQRTINVSKPIFSLLSFSRFFLTFFTVPFPLIISFSFFFLEN